MVTFSFQAQHTPSFFSPPADFSDLRPIIVSELDQCWLRRVEEKEHTKIHSQA